jgi:hypothetical protein
MNKLFGKKGTPVGGSKSDSKGSPVDQLNRKAINISQSEFEIEKARDSWGLSMQLKKKLITIGLVFGCLIILRYSCSSDGTPDQETISIQRNTELESIENKIIIGLDGSRNKTQLLDYVTQLSHSDAENYIDGKKQGIIANDIYGPDHDFFGTYAQYWTGLREGYKEIILRDITIDDYKKELNKKISSKRGN